MGLPWHMRTRRGISDFEVGRADERLASTGAYWLTYDGLCAVCRAAMRLLRAMDWFGRIRFVDGHAHAAEVGRRVPELTPEQLQTAIRLITPSGKVSAGFFAIRRAAWLLPAMWPGLPLMYVPGASRAGPAIYRWIARHRYALSGCVSGGSCKL